MADDFTLGDVYGAAPPKAGRVVITAPDGQVDYTAMGYQPVQDAAGKTVAWTPPAGPPQSGATAGPGASPAPFQAPLPTPQQAAPAPPAAAPAQGDDISLQEAYANVAPPDNRPVSEGQGFREGYGKTMENLATWAQMIPGLPQLDAALSHVTGAPTLEQTRQLLAADRAKEAQTSKPGEWGKIAGNITSTLPAMALPGGVLTQGAIGGALNTDKPTDPLAVATDAATGAIANKGLQFGGKVLLDTVAPVLSDSVKTLVRAGVPLTTDMLTGGKGTWGVLGKIASITPLAAELRRGLGDNALTHAASAWGNDLMSAINPGLLPQKSPDALFQAAQRAKSAAYKAVEDGVSDVSLGGPYAANMANVRSQIASLPRDFQRKYLKTMFDEVQGRINKATGSIPIEGLTAAKEAINKQISEFGGQGGFSKQYADALGGVKRALTESLGATSPAAREALARADKAYPGYVIFRDAMGRTARTAGPATLPTPGQMLASIGKHSTDEALAAHAGRGQKFAQAAADVLPQKFAGPRHWQELLSEAAVGLGVGGSELFHNAAHPALALTAAMSGLYTKPVQKALVAGLTQTALLRQLLARAGAGQAATPITAATRAAATAAALNARNTYLPQRQQPALPPP